MEQSRVTPRDYPTAWAAMDALAGVHEIINPGFNGQIARLYWDPKTKQLDAISSNGHGFIYGSGCYEIKIIGQRAICSWAYGAYELTAGDIVDRTADKICIWDSALD